MIIMTTNRNSQCKCGSGIKTKKCCGQNETKGAKFVPKLPTYADIEEEANRNLKKLKRMKQRGF